MVSSKLVKKLIYHFSFFKSWNDFTFTTTSFLFFSFLCNPCGSSLESPSVLERPAFPPDCLMWSDPLLRRKHSVSHSISERPPRGPAVRVLDAFGNNFSYSLVQRLKSRPAQLFSRQSTAHAAAANHVFHWSDIDATQQTARQGVTQWVLLLAVTLITIVHNSWTAFPGFVAPTREKGRYMKRRLQGQHSCCQVRSKTF